MIEINNVSKEFIDGDEKFLALKETTIKIKDKEFVAVIGPSGSGKSTFLTIVGALQQPTHGNLIINQHDVYDLSENERSDLRFNDIGFILQGSNLIPFLTIREQYHLKLKKYKKKERNKRIDEVLNLLSISKLADKYPEDISGGERQKAAIGLAILLKPRLVLADEPTASLDTDKAIQIVELLQTISEKDKTSVVMVTHDERMVEYCNRVIQIIDGDVNEIEPTKK